MAFRYEAGEKPAGAPAASGTWHRRAKTIVLDGVYAGSGRATQPRDVLAGELKAPARCLRPLGGMPAKGMFSAPMRDGTRWYTPASGDNLWRLAKTVLVRMFAQHNVHRAPSSREIATLSDDIRQDPCNAHLKDRMFLPRFGPDRVTPGGQYYGSIHIRAKF